MNHTTARCGCSVIAVGAPGSLARRAVESRTCGKPRCGFCSATLSVDPQQTRRTSEDPVEPVKRAKR